MSRVVLQRDAPGKYTVEFYEPFETTPLRVNRKTDRWGSFWAVSFDGKSTLGVVAEWQQRLAPGTWDVTFGSASEGFDTLRAARLKLEEAVREGEARSEAAEAHLGGDPAGSTSASGACS